MTMHTHGISKRSLLLLGGLTAAITDSTSRRKLLNAVGSAADTAQSLYQDTVKPLAQQAQQQLQEGVLDVSARTQELAQMAAERGSELAHVAAERGVEYAQVAVERGSDLAHVAAKRGSEFAAQGSEAAASIAALAAVRGGKVAASLKDGVAELRETGGKQAQKQVQGLLSSAQDALEDVRKDGGKVVGQKVRQGRKQALKLQKELSHEVSVRGAKLEKLSGRKLKAAEKGLKKELKNRARQVEHKVKGQPEPSGNPAAGVLVSLGLLLGGGVLLARVPAVRHSILKAVGSVSPEAAEALHAAGSSVRDIVGSVWLERIEPENATAAPAPKPSQATGSAAYASVEPGSPAQETPPKQPDLKPGEADSKN